VSLISEAATVITRSQRAGVTSIASPGGCDDGDTMVVRLKMESNVRGAAATFHPPSTYRFNGLVATEIPRSVAQT